MAERGDWKSAVSLAARAGVISAESASEVASLLEERRDGDPGAAEVARWMGVSEASLLALLTVARTLPEGASDEEMHAALDAHLQGFRAIAQVRDATPATLPMAAPTIDSQGDKGTLPLGDSSSAQTVAGEAQPQMLGLPRVPKQLGPYALADQLGQGGMGIVYRARHEKLGTPCAVKVLIAGEHASAQAIARFQREAAAVAKMGKHPNIVNVFDLGQEGSLFYYAMELVEGKALRTVLRERRPSRIETATLVEKVARALHFAHQHGIVHRDVKPDNILLRGDGEPQVTDFGLARDVTSNAALSGTGQLLGTPNYMAPEQVDGMPEAIDARTDVYALGVVLYEMLTGAQAFPGDSVVGVFAKVLTGEAAPPRSLAPDTPKDLETICMKAMSPEPLRRYQSAEAFAEDVARFTRGDPVLARPVGLAERLWRKAKRNRVASLLGAGLFLAVLVALGELGWYAMLPRLRAAASAREEARLRAQRHDAANVLLEKASDAEGQGRADQAAGHARELIQDFAPYAAKGEDLPISEAHEVLARLARARNDARGALVEFYRAYESAIATPRAAGTLARIGDQLYEMDEQERARGVFERALEERPDGRADFLARSGIARCHLSATRFDEARAELLSLRTRPEGTAEESVQIERLLRFLELVTPYHEAGTGEFNCFLPVDLDGDGKCELVSITDDGRGVVVYRFDGGAFTEAARCRVLSDEPFLLTRLAAGDAVGDGQKEILVAGGDGNRQAGAVAVLAFRKGSLDLLARAPLVAQVEAHGLAVAHIAGEQAAEVLVGTGAYERALHLYRLDVAERRLKELGKVDLGGDAFAVVPRDADGNGRSDVWVFVGPWSGYSLDCFQVDAATGNFERRSSTPFSAGYVVDPAACSGGSGRFLVFARWWEAQLAPLREIYGRRYVEKNYRAPGLYEVRLQKDPQADLVPVWSLEHVQEMLGGSVFTFHGKDAVYAWASPPPPAAGRPPGDGACILEHEGDTWKPFLRLHPPAGTSEPVACDVDGDGASELLVGLPVTDAGGSHVHRIAILGLGGLGAPTPNPAPPSSVVAARLPRRTSSARLIAAREAARVGLFDEALDAFAQVAAAPPSAEDLEEAALGALECRVRLGRSVEAEKEASRTMASYPVLKAPLGRALLEAMETSGEWEAARQTAEELLGVPGIAEDERASLASRAASLAQLCRPGAAFEAEKGFASCDLLSTSPLWATLSADGAVRLSSSSNGRQAIFVPFAYDRASLRLHAEVAAERLDWATGLDVGFLAGDPASSPMGDRGLSIGEAQFGRFPTLQTVRISATGESSSPVRHCDLSHYSAGKGGSKWILDGVTPGAKPIRIGLEYAAHRRWLSCTVDAGAGPVSAREEDAPMEEVRMFLTLGSSGGGGSLGCWGNFTVRRLAVDAGSASVRPVRFEPQRAVDLLLLANGRWIQGKTDEARGLYDRAVKMADLEAQKDREMKAQGLPSPLDAPWAQPFLKWVPVDARFWRGLLRVETGDAEGAKRDLQDASDLSNDRFRALVEGHALVLLDHANSAAAVRRHILAQAGMDDSSEITKYLKAVFEGWGGDVADLMVAPKGMRLRRAPAVGKVQGDPCGLQEGDLIRLFDGKEVADFGAFRHMQGDALDAEKASVEVVVSRDGNELRAKFDPRRTRIAAQEQWVLEKAK